jgi:hypothetical protein
VIDNHHGEGFGPGVYYYARNCVLHGHDEKPNRRREAVLATRKKKRGVKFRGELPIGSRWGRYT